MTAARHFVPLDGPFDIELAGTHLVEAGAGTGKTWTIGALALRLLLEREFRIGEILVVTYTRAATGELRGRIRARLVEALAAFAQNDSAASGDPFLRDLVARLDAGPAQARLRLAIESFDEAAIFTIHGFCQRALAEAAFEAGLAFERELLAEQQELLGAVARDAWRRLLADASPGWAAWLIGAFRGPAGLAAPVRAHLGRIDVRLAAPPLVDRRAAEADFAAAFTAARALWQAGAEAIVARIAAAPLHRGSYPPDKLPARAAALDGWFAEEEARLPLPKDAASFGAARFAEKTNRGGTPPEHPFFAAMDVLLAAAARLEAAYVDATRRALHDFLLAARAGLAERKRRGGQQTYDDLLADLALALRGPGGDALAERLRARYRVALVDEFQDTDPLQLDIFTRVFGAPAQPLFFVGDPKQAIYGFRGADVFAYLAARGHADAGYALLHNRRSDAPLLRVFNALFGRPRPFLLDALPFDPAEPARMARREFRVDDGQAPFVLWSLAKPAEAKELTKTHAGAAVAEATAADIARLLALAGAGRARIDGRPLGGGDIAVLVRKRQQGESVRQALARHGIASVALGGGSVWQSEEAGEVERLLRAVAAPAREGLVRAALASVLLGADVARLARWEADEEDWRERLDRFHDDHRLCRERGFMAMWRRLLRREEAVPRLLARPDGERRLTNYRHLAELLQAAEHAGALDAAGLARHMEEMRDAPEAEDSQLRLESDAQLVRIVTIHAAKGLQYPVVYCPYLWDGPQASKDNGDGGVPVLAHDPDSGAACLDFGSGAIGALRRQAALESAAEELRLAYVALTRAEHRCVVAWGKAKQSENSPLAWLLFGPHDDVGDDPRAALAAKFAATDEAALLAEAHRLAAGLDGALQVLPLPADGARAPVCVEAQTALAARPFRGAIPAPWRVTSFSALAASLEEEEAPDRDAVAASVAVPPAPTFAGDDRSIHAFPRGTRAGSCLHALLERTDFLAPERAPAAEALAEFGYAPEWRPALARMAADVVAAPLDAAGLTLAQVPWGERLVELEFAFPLGSAAERAGYMKGFIDLVFRHDGRWYIVDWKSNWLGPRAENYAPERLDEAMRAHRYDLQLRIYAAALKRALALREPDLDWETAFGGVFYLFLRGMAPGAPHGIHFSRPTDEEIAPWLK
jgi:exodeoxyribonuclease V beta subunit